MLLELAAAVVLGVVALGVVFGPLVRGRTPPGLSRPSLDDDPPPAEETPRGQALLALRELDFDRATGKLGEGDYTALRDRYLAQAVALLKADQTTDGAEALIARRAAQLERGNGRPTPACPRCGPRPEPDARFCSACGLDLGGTCASCRAALPAGARFCPTCGEQR
jgi:hypothetical protein